MKVLVALLCLVVAVAAVKNAEWEQYKQKHDKVYKSAVEDRRRMKIYFESKKLVQAHNAKYENGQVTFKMGLNRFADWTNEEYKITMLSPRNAFKKRFVNHAKGMFVKPANFKASDSVDWRPLGYVTDVKDQGDCGSCWAFSTTGQVEGAHFNATGELVSLSEQNLMDCSYSYGNAACQGGMQEYAYDYITDNQGIDTEASYPYEERDGLCRYDPANNGATEVKGYISILPRGDEDVQKDAVASVGPVSVSMDASLMSFQLYESGVYYDPLCKNGFFELDHGVLAVGYGTDPDDGDYWIVKNSWGTSWGEEGYFQMARNRDNNCGIATDSLYAKV